MSRFLTQITKTTESLTGCLNKSVWLIISAILLFMLASLLYRCTTSNKPKSTNPRPTTIHINSSHQKVFRDCMAKARTAAEKAAEEELIELIAQMNRSIEETFLPWYFSYITQQGLQIKNLYYTAASTITQTPADKKMADYIQQQFNAQVISPEALQLRIQNIAERVVNIYFTELNTQLSLNVDYTVTTPSLDNTPATPAKICSYAEGLREIPVTVKVITGAGVYQVSKLVCSRLVLPRAGAVGIARGTAMTAGKLSIVVTVAVIVWEVADHYFMVKRNKPALQKALADYLDEYKQQLRAELLRVLDDVEYQTAAQLRDGS